MIESWLIVDQVFYRVRIESKFSLAKTTTEVLASLSITCNLLILSVLNFFMLLVHHFKYVLIKLVKNGME